MTDNHKNGELDILDRATAALREAPHAEGPPPKAIASTLTAIQRELQLNPEPPRRLKDWRPIMIRTARFSAAAIVLIAAIAGAVLLSTSNEVLAFAEVQQEIAKLQTARFAVQFKLPDQPLITGTIYLNAHQMRQESAQHGIMIADTKKAKGVLLDPAAKKAIIGEISDLPSNPLQSLREVAEKDARFIREEQRDGRRTLVYHVSNAHIMGMRGEMTVWVDPQSKLPVRIEVGHEEEPDPQNATILLHDFTWNQPLDPELFSLEVPEGYQVERQTVQWSDAPAATIAAGLAAYADLSGGTFPTELDSNTAKQLEQKIRETTGTWPVDNGVAKMLAIDRAAVAVQQVRQGDRDWHYAAGNVKRGERSKPIVWFKHDPNGDRYHVIFADLSYVEIAADQLPRFIDGQ